MATEGSSRSRIEPRSLAHRSLVATLFLLCLMVSAPADCAWSGPLARFTTRNKDWPFNHLLVDDTSGTVYVGGMNRIYQLSANLSELHVHETGPALDNSECYPPHVVQQCGETLSATDNINKLLLVEKRGRRLLACGSLYQGVCKLLTLENLFKQGEPNHRSEHYLSSVSETGTTAGFIVPGRTRHEDDILYVGTPVGGKVDYFPTVSSRWLRRDSESAEMFTFIYHNEFESSKMNIPSDTLSMFPSFDIYYVYAFASGGFAYFLTVHPESRPNSPGEDFFTSKIVRLCLRDENFYSYVELPLGCGKDGSNYLLLQAAHVARAGQRLARSLHVDPDDDVLYTVFSKDQKNRLRPPRKTLLCVFSLHAINEQMKSRIKACYRGDGSLDLTWHNNRHMPCIPAQSVNISDDFCGLNLNQPLAGEQTVWGIPLLAEAQDGMTAVRAYVYNEQYAIVFVGTTGGNLKKGSAGCMRSTTQPPLIGTA